MAQPFDVERLAVTGDPVRVVDGVRSDPLFRWLGFSVSHQGGLAYVGGGGGGAVTQLRWLDRSGADLGTVGEPGGYHDPVLSPDETKVAVGRDDGVWILDVSRGTEQRFTFDPALDGAPIWSPDGSRIVFSSFRDGRPGDLYEKAAAGTGQAQLLLESDYFKLATDWSTDGEFVSYHEATQKRPPISGCCRCLGIASRRRFSRRLFSRQMEYSRRTGAGWPMTRLNRASFKSMCRAFPPRVASGRCRPLAEHFPSGGATVRSYITCRLPMT